METVVQFVDDWEALLLYCRGGVEPKTFKSRHDSLAHRYRRLNEEEQGEISYIIYSRRNENT